MRSSIRGLIRRAQIELNDLSGPLMVSEGGTGVGTVAQGDILYASSVDTLVALAKNTTATRYLSNTGAGNNPAWAQVNLTNGVTGTLPAGNLPTASETASGIVELATNAEAVTGTDTTRPVVPAALTARLAAPGPIGGTTPAAITGTTITGSSLVSTGLVDISAAGAGQIKFPATQNASADANTLDDYEEGTFTVAASFGGGTTGITYAVQAGAYRKIGSQVTVWFRLVLTNNGSSTGQARITGIPITPGSDASLYGGGNGLTQYSGMIGLTGAAQAMVSPSTATLDLAQEGATQVTGLTDANVSDSAAMHSNVTYFV